MDVSIIIISHNTRILLESCLTSVYRSLRSARFSFEMIVVDNASSDGSVAMVKRRFPNVRILTNSANDGFGKANNRGIKKAAGSYILLLNSDTEVRGDAIATLYAFSLSRPRSFTAPKLVNPDGSDQPSCGLFFTLPVVFASLFLKGDYIGLSRWSPQNIMKADWASGACLMAPKKIFSDGLFFNERIFMYMDEIDLLFRASRKGYDVWVNPNAQVMHVGSGSAEDGRKTPIMNIYRGILGFYHAYYPGWRETAVKGMLQWKAMLGIWYGSLAGNQALKQTYEEAIRLVR